MAPALPGVWKGARWSWGWAPLAFVPVYLGFLVWHLGSVIQNVYADADAASAPVIGQLFSAAPSSAHVVLGNLGWYSTLMFELATKWLPFHREIWLGAGYVLLLAAAMVIAWSVWRLAGPLAASIAAVIVICAAPDTLHLSFALDSHAQSWFSLALLGVFLVAADRRPELSPGLLVASVVLGVFEGVNAASDTLLLLSGLLPFAIAMLVVWWPRRSSDRAAALTAGGVVLLSAGVTRVLTLTLMPQLHVSPRPQVPTTAIASLGQLPANFLAWAKSAALLGNGLFEVPRLSPYFALKLVCAGLIVGAVALLPVAVVREFRLRRSSVRLLFTVFWCGSGLILSAAYVFGAFVSPSYPDRYLVGIIYAVAAVMPLFVTGGRRARIGVLVGTCLFALSGTIAMGRGDVSSPRALHSVSYLPGDAKRIESIATARGLQVGYAGYWDSAPITWETRFRIRVYPIMTCGTELCRFNLHLISSWYRPRFRTPTFLLTDRNQQLSPHAPPGGLGRPIGVYRLDHMTMYLYRYDLARKLR